MKIKIYHADAFTKSIFGGNPAAVCPLDKWLPDTAMQNIAMENNLAETVFFVKNGSHFHIRWFTPATEVNLCGHATLAAAFVLYNYEGYKEDIIHFDSKSGELTVKKDKEKLTLNFPADRLEKIASQPRLATALGVSPIETYKGKTDYMLIYESQDQIENMSPDFRQLAKVEARGIIVTAKGKDCDFVSRFFAPQCGIDEDPVTGSAHTSLTPYWSTKLGKTELNAIQLSKRKGYLQCKNLGERIEITGEVKLYLQGEIEINL